MLDYEVIIIGAGPVGIALGIELGMLQIKTLILEKHADPTQLPRAQLINPRTMEFFRRWGVQEQIIKKKLLPDDFPLHAVWCAGLAGTIYSAVDLSERVNLSLSPEKYQRVPLWITEEVLRERIKQFPSVTLLSEAEVFHIEQNLQQTTVHFKNKNPQTISANYIVACDGARSITREKINIEMENILPGIEMWNVLFQSSDIKTKMTVPQGVLYYNLTLKKPAALGCVDYKNGLWYSLMSKSDEDIEKKLDEQAGFPFDKKILQAKSWTREAKIAKQFRKERIFLAGDAAHVLPPTGGHGLNTGFGDVVNLAWKLAAVLRNKATDELLDTYEFERKPVAMRNINASIKNAKDADQVRQQFPPDVMPGAFAKENERIAKQHAIALGIAMGYCYEKEKTTDESHYFPQAEKGFFAPHIFLESNTCLYDRLENEWTLLCKNKTNEVEIFSQNRKLKIIELPDNAIYTKSFYLIRPDWHIAWCGDKLTGLSLRGVIFATKQSNL